MFDDTKIQALADDLRGIVCKHIRAGIYSLDADNTDIFGDIAPGLLGEVLNRLLADMLEDRNHCLALLETLKQQFSGE